MKALTQIQLSERRSIVLQPLAAWRLLAGSIFFISLALSSCPMAGAVDSPNEYQVKGGFLFNFAKFIDWPPEAFSTAQSPFAICILGQDPFGTTLDEILAGKSMATHPVVVRRLKETVEARHCEVVFVSASESRNYAAIVEGLRGSNALLVGETEGFATEGGAIEFTLEQNHVRFTINPDAAQRAGLKCSSKLLALAHIVHDGSLPSAVAGKS